MPTVFTNTATPPSSGQSRQKMRFSTHKMLQSYAVTPRDIRFETQEDDERVILFLREHIIFLLPIIFVGIVMLIVPWTVFPLVLRYLFTSFTLPASYIFVGTLLWYVATFGFVLGKFLHWFFNIYIVTDQRIIDIDFIHLLYKEFSETRYESIEDISYKSGGILATMFNFGDVNIQTAGEHPNFSFHAVPHPEIVVDTISDILHGRTPTILKDTV
jgi:hypothetical protein